MTIPNWEILQVEKYPIGKFFKRGSSYDSWDIVTSKREKYPIGKFFKRGSSYDSWDIVTSKREKYPIGKFFKRGSSSPVMTRGIYSKSSDSTER